MGLDGGRSIEMPKSSSESLKLEFSDSEFVFGGGVKFKGGIDMGSGHRERDRDLGVETGIWGVETGIWRVEMGISGGGDGDLGGGEGDLEGEDLCLFHQARRVLGESGWELVLQGNPHVVVCPCFSVDL